MLRRLATLTVGVVVLTPIALVSATTGYADAALTADPTSVTLDAQDNVSARISNGSGDVVTVLTTLVVGGRGSVSQPAPRTAIVPGDTREVRATVPSLQPGMAVVIRYTAGAAPAVVVLRIPLVVTTTVKSWTVQRVGGSSVSSELVPIQGPCSGLGLSSGSVGTLQSGGSSVTVSAKCDGPNDKSVELVIGHGDDGHSYAGPVVLGTGASALSVDVTYTTTWQWYCVAGLLVAGLVVALVVTWLTGAGRARGLLVRRTFVIDRMVRTGPLGADGLFRTAAIAGDLPDNVQGWLIRDAVIKESARCRAQARGLLTGDSGAGPALDRLEATVKDWPKLARDLARLKPLLPNIGAFVAYVSRLNALAFDRVAGAVSLEEVDTIHTTVAAALDLATQWQSVKFSEEVGMAEDLPPTSAARSDFRDARVRLSQAITPEEQKEARTAFFEALRAVHREHAARPDGEGLVFVEGVAPMSDIRIFGVPGDPEAAVRGWSLTLLLSDYVVLLVLLAASVVTGLQTFWIGKTFGSPSDIALALTWGLVAGAVALPLATALTNVGRSWGLVLHSGDDEPGT